MLRLCDARMTRWVEGPPGGRRKRGGQQLLRLRGYADSPEHQTGRDGAAAVQTHTHADALGRKPEGAVVSPQHDARPGPNPGARASSGPSTHRVILASHKRSIRPGQRTTRSKCPRP